MKPKEAAVWRVPISISDMFGAIAYAKTPEEAKYWQKVMCKAKELRISRVLYDNDPYIAEWVGLTLNYQNPEWCGNWTRCGAHFKAERR